MVNLEALQWHPRTDVFPDAKDTWIAFPNGYSCHIIYRESTKDSLGLAGKRRAEQHADRCSHATPRPP
jgi:hypothetical protein